MTFRIVTAIVLVSGLVFSVGCTKKEDKGSDSSQGLDDGGADQVDVATDTDASSDDGYTDTADEPGDDGFNVGSLAITATLPSDNTATHALAFPVSSNGPMKDTSQLQSVPLNTGALALEIGGHQLLDGGGEGDDGDSLSHVIVLYEEGADRFETAETFQFVNVPVGNSEAINLFTGEAETETIDLGELTASGDALTAENAIEEGDFSVPTDVLEELASTDDSLRSLKNTFMNNDPATGHYVSARPFFQWEQEMAPALTGFAPADENGYFGYGLYFDTNRPEITLAKLCNSTSPDHVALKLVPPGSLTMQPPPGQAIPASVTELTNAGSGAVVAAAGTRSECGSTSDTSFYGHADTQDASRTGWNWGGISGPIAAGYWDLFYGNDKIARFDLGSVFPFDNNNKPIVYLPAVKILTEGDLVKGAEIKLYRYVDGELKELTDLAAFRKVVKWFGFSFSGFSTGNQHEEYQTFDVPETGAVLSLDMAKYNIEWRIPDANGDVPSGERLEAIAFLYNLYGNDYRFGYRGQSFP